MTDAYCSYEISKLLQKKGFDEPTLTFYIPFEDGEVKFNIGSNEIHYNTLNKYPWIIAAPTHQMACAWLREEKNIIIVIEPHAYDYSNKKTSSYVFAIWEGDNYIETYSNSKLRGISYLTYEDAVESAIKYCLENLI